MASDYYDHVDSEEYASSLYIEVAILQEEVILPTPWISMMGKFDIPQLFPLVEKSPDGKPYDIIHDPPSTKHIICKGFKSQKYYERNFIRLTIPSYLFSTIEKYDTERNVHYIPKGTRFIVAFVGGSSSVAYINIIGLEGKKLPVGNK